VDDELCHSEVLIPAAHNSREAASLYARMVMISGTDQEIFPEVHMGLCCEFS